MTTFDDILDAVTEREETLYFAIAFLACILAGMGVDWFFFLDSGARGVFTVLFITSFMLVVSILIAKENKETKYLDTIAVLKDKHDLQKKATKAEENATAQTAKATALQVQLDELATATQKEATELQRLRGIEATANAKIATANNELATVQAELATAREALATAEQVSATALATARKEVATANATVANRHSEIKQLQRTVSELTPYHTFFMSFVAYKQAESVKNSRTAEAGDKENAKAQFDIAKDAMMSFYTEHTKQG